MKSLHLISFLVLCAVRTFADAAADYAALTAGLTTVPGSGGTPGTVVMHGRTAFPVFTENTNGTAPVVAAGHWNDDTDSGRGLAYAHTGWAATNGNNGLALSNAIRWAARGKANAVIGLGGGMPSVNWFTAQGYTTKSLSTTMTTTNNDFTGVDVALISMHSGYSSNALFKAATFLTNGGGILIFSTPWALSSTAYADANNLLVNLGLSFSGDYNNGGALAVSATPYPSYVSALNGLDLLLAQRNGTTNVAASIQQAAADGIDGVLAVRPLFPPLTNGLVQLLATYGGFISINANRTLTKANVPIESLCERYQSGLFDITPAAQLPKHPDADDWPGAVATNAPVVNKTVIVKGNAPPDDPALINQGSHGTRQPVGLYARAGTVLRVIIPADKTGAGLRIQIGHHHDENFNLNSWHRHPKVARYEPLTNVVNEIGSPYGGLILVRVPPDSLLGNFPITIEGAVEAPHFEQNADSPADWARLKSLPGAQGYIRTSNFTAYVSRNALQGVSDPTVVANHWGNVIATGDHFMGYLFRFREEAGKTDRDIVAGGGHAGYPFVMAYGDDDELVRGVLGDGDWGYYHELGHTFQDNGHGWNGTAGGEVDVNVIPNLLMTLIHRRSLWDNNTHSTMDAANRASGRAAFFATPLAQRSWFDVNGGDVAGYDFFFNLPESFGYDLWRRAFSRFYRWSTNNASEPSFAGLDRYNRWFVGMCEESGYNLAPYFDNYGWTNITPAVKARFTGLPTWSSNRPPTVLNLGTPFTLNEATPPGTLAATFATTDPDPGNLFIYSILSGNEDGAFTLDRWSGELRVASLDYERKSNYVLTVTVFDNALPRYFLTNTLVINVTNVSEPPILITPLMLASNTQPVGFVLGTVTAIAEAGKSITNYSLVSGGPVFAINPTNGMVTRPGSPLPNPGVITLFVSATDSAGLSITGCVQVLCNALSLLRDRIWNGTSATGPPASDTLISSWRTISTGDNYVRRLTGWLVPSQTGLFTFWVTGSDRATFYLGTNSNPSSLVELCTGASAGVNNFDADPEQRSAPVWLEGGKIYALEVFQTEVTGSDYAQAAWQGPGVPTRTVIPTGVIIPDLDLFFPSGGVIAPVVGVALRFGFSDATTYTAPASIPLNADLSGGVGSATNVQFLVNGAAIAGDNTFPFSGAWNGVSAGSHIVQAVARDSFGNVVTSPARLVNVFTSITANTLVASNAVWKYHNFNQDLGTAWRETNYNDGIWPSGPARIGFGGDGEMTSIDIGPSNARYPTVYFRRTVNLTNLSRYLGFTMGIARDDGAVAYVNGQEVFRTSMNPGAVTFTTPGLNAADEQTFFTTNLPPSVFHEGTNTLAVEVHQVNATSGDLGFAMKLEGAFTTPAFSAVITDPAPGASLLRPASLEINTQATTPNGTITNIVVRADGSAIGSTAAASGGVAWTLPPVGAHTLTAVAQNSLGQSVTSAPVMVTILANNPPAVALLTAGGTVTNPPTLFVDAGASDGDEFITSVELFDGTSSLGSLNGPILTWLFPSPALGLHTLRAVATDNHGLTSTSGPVFLYVIAAPLATNLTLVASNGLWKYHDEGVDLGNAWTNVTYPDATWSNGVARLGFGGDGEVTPLRGQPRITYYFRKMFFAPAGFTGTNLTVRLSRDDGAIVYLNGREIVRDNMPGGAVSYTNRASAAVSAPNEQAFFTFITNAVALRVGTNILAAEVHQIDNASGDIGFNIELTASGSQASVNSPPPLLNLTSLSATQLRISFTDVDGLAYAVEGSTNLPAWFSLTTNLVSGGVFQFVTNPTNPPAQFFRVRRVP